MPASPSAADLAASDNPRARWTVAGLLFAATFINYIDRQTFSIAAPLLAREYSLSNSAIANVVLAFTLAYTIGQALAGKLIDAMGTRPGFAAIMLLWSLAGAATATAGSVGGFIFWRFLLGLGEAGNWPACVKAVAEWFSPRQRAFGNAVFTAGSSAGAIAAPVLIGLMIQHWGWQRAFIVTGVLGITWIAAWLPLFRRGPYAEAPRAAAHPAARGDYFRLFTYRPVWGLILIRFFTDPVWWFYIAWLPKYMADERGFDMRAITSRLWIPYVTSAFGGLVAGWAYSRLASAGWPRDRARKTVMTVAALLMLSGIWVSRVGSADLALWLVSLSVFGFYGFAVNTHAIVSDVFPPRLVATVSGISGVGAGIGSIIFTKIVGIVADKYSFGPVFLVAGLMPLIALFGLWVLMGRIEESRN